jgi:thiol-disulfide isomerase/thioredoxin
MKAAAAVALLVSVLSLSCKAPAGGSAGPGEAKELKPAPDLVLTKVDGSGTIALAEQKGKVVLVDLWATWCAPCIKELPRLQALSEKFGEDFLMLGVVLESGDPEEIQAFIVEKEIRYPQVLGEEGTKESFGPFLGYPTKYLIDRDGRVVKRYFGMMGDELAADVEKLLQTGSLDEPSAG